MSSQDLNPGGGGPAYGWTSTASTDVLAASGDEPPAKRPSWAVVGGAGLLVAGLVGGITYGVGALSGGGTQPEEALPAGAFGFVKVDLDPSAGQKIDGYRFLRKFPALRERLTGDDARKAVFEAVADGFNWDTVDFDAEVAPWMGQRVAFAAYPPDPTGDADPEPDVVVALQVSDADEAREGLDRLADLAVAGTEPGEGLGFAVTGDYALLASTQTAADEAAAEAANGTLVEDGDFSADLAAAPDGVLTVWVDMEAASRAVAPLGLGPASVLGLGGGVGSLAGGATGLRGRSTYVARFDGPDVFEVTGTTTGAEPAGWATHRVEGLAELPASSVVAFGLADGDELVPKLLDAVRQALESAGGMPGAPTYEDLERDAERQLGVEIPEDLAALLGENLVAALDAGRSDTLQVGARVRSDDVARAEKVLEAFGRTGFELPVVRRVGDEELVVASSGAQADRLSTAGDLGDKDAFSDALPGLDDADAALWVDVKGLSGLFGEGGQPDDDVEPIEGVGVTVSSPGEDTTSLTFRLVAR